MHQPGTAVAFIRNIIYSGLIAGALVTVVGQFVTLGDPTEAESFYEWLLGLAWLGTAAWAATIEDGATKNVTERSILRDKLRAAEERLRLLEQSGAQEVTERERRAHEEWKRDLDSP